VTSDPGTIDEGTRDERLEAIAASLGIGAIDRHIFVCAQQSNPKCSSYEESSATWKHLKSRLRRLGLASSPPRWQSTDIDQAPPPTDRGTGTVLRSKVDCLRICEHGPIAVVYPEGIWYRSVDPAAMDRIIDEHILEGRPVESLRFATDELSAARRRQSNTEE
jgi:(2Fe-2S) ferredoxin